MRFRLLQTRITSSSLRGNTWVFQEDRQRLGERNRETHKVCEAASAACSREDLFLLLSHTSRYATQQTPTPGIAAGAMSYSPLSPRRAPCPPQRRWRLGPSRKE